ncbi:MAG: tetratricopeptide repeat protein, partial [Algisphaera sp.]
PDAARQVIHQIAAALDRDGAAALVAEVGGQANPLWTGLGLVNLDLAELDYASALERLTPLKPLVATEPGLADRVVGLEALCLLQTGKTQEAKAAYEGVLASQPNNVQALNNLSYMLLTTLNDPEAALPLAERAAQLSAQNPDILDTYGMALHRVGRLEEARLQLETSVGRKAKPSSLLHLGQLYADLNFIGRARTRLEEAIDQAQATNDEETALLARRALEQIEER